MEVHLYVDRSGMMVAKAVCFCPHDELPRVDELWPVVRSCSSSLFLLLPFFRYCKGSVLCLWKVGKKRCNYGHAQKQLPALTIRMVLDRRHSLETRPEKSICCGILQCHHYVRWFLFGKCNWFSPYKICNHKILTLGIDLIVTMRSQRPSSSWMWMKYPDHAKQSELTTQVLLLNEMRAKAADPPKPIVYSSA